MIDRYRKNSGISVPNTLFFSSFSLYAKILVGWKVGSLIMLILLELLDYLKIQKIKFGYLI